jgi:hypothetical protein
VADDPISDEPMARRLESIQEFDAVDQLRAPEERDDEGGGVPVMERALEILRVHHLPFRRATQDELRELEERRLALLEAVVSEPALADYYDEAWKGTVRPPLPAEEPFLYRRIAVRQLQLMERAFYLLQLYRFANAPENAGWMNLLRRWGASRRFNLLFDELSRTLTPEFCRFYKLYLRDLPPPTDPACADLEGGDKTDAEERPPIHHPWLRRRGDRGKGLFMDSGLVDVDVRAGAGSLVDQKGDENVRESHETPADSPGAQKSGPDHAPNE